MRFFIVWMKYPAMARMMNRTMMMTAMAMFSFILSFSFLYVLVVVGLFQNGRIKFEKTWSQLFQQKWKEVVFVAVVVVVVVVVEMQV
ncbi:hypothetical protein BDQ94DRAFT_138107 [Aspergillus welwitschiae]|uniref:Uncharacterized protein n=1 Tax=Aspergillus welwitschiae TaxID=1341132 RepID=A0A3F3QBU8_9EURO|nr:hypothetical protein BDQ94DRAFT_138107 [Aspergillus welwitschiae]RDH36597.1 hypothetical protein BDQ94DRAFT_138107 [Aspergillus welwitschiae]